MQRRTSVRLTVQRTTSLNVAAKGLVPPSVMPRILGVAAEIGLANLGNDRQMVGSEPAELAHMASQRTREAAVAQHHTVEREQW